MSDITGDAEGPEPIEPTEPVVPAPVVPAPVAPVTPDPEPTPAPAAAKVGEERQAFNSFIAAVVPVLKTPIVVTTALAVLLALVTSLVVSTIVAMLVNLIAGDDLPDDGGAWWEFAWSAHFTSHQVPFANDDTWIALHPFLFLAIALASAGFGVWLAHRLLAGRGANDAAVAAPAYSPLVAALTFAATYTVANLILSAFGPEDLGIRLLLGIILTFVIA
ncbi:MAG: hypothetical protein JWO69_1370, partial [Thermoleophilia bacterium]|nr:hypothetical protein [Thermoleophilia bacterium]